jgi:NAD-dependent deacetylase
MSGDTVGIPDSLRERLASAGNLVVLTGAGVSAESGVPTFRGHDGLWRNYDPKQLATPEAFERDPKLVWEWYIYRRGLMAGVQPNPGHKAIAELERLYTRFLLVTQNVDNLHSRAGSREIVELHGNIFRIRCSSCGKKSDQLPDTTEIPPRCECGAYLRPDVVWFGEMLPAGALEKAWQASEECDCMLVVGTSAVVQPAASLPLVAKRNGAFVAEINFELTPLSDAVDVSIIGRAGEIMPRVVAAVRRRRDGRE